MVHVEAGIRPGDMSMPEEINRIVTDAICDHFFTTSSYANENLMRYQVPEKRIHFVGNAMIDTLYQNLDKLKKPLFWDRCQLDNGSYFLVTLHRPSNVDDPEKLKQILDAITNATLEFPVLFPVHPRTRKIMDTFKISTDKLIMIEPLGYHEFIYLVKNTKGVITDSGGITEESTVLHVPCLTLRNSTERPETVIIGTNELIGDDFAKLENCLGKIVKGDWKKGTIPEFWDGKTAERIVEILQAIYSRELQQA